MNHILQDNGVIKIELRSVTDPVRAAQVIEQQRNAAADGIPQQHEDIYWLGQVYAAMAQGAAIEVVINGGAPVGTALALPDAMDPTRAVLVACELMTDYVPESGIPLKSSMLTALRDFAASHGRTLAQRVVRVVWEPV